MTSATLLRALLSRRCVCPFRPLHHRTSRTQEGRAARAWRTSGPGNLRSELHHPCFSERPREMPLRRRGHVKPPGETSGSPTGVHGQSDGDEDGTTPPSARPTGPSPPRTNAPRSISARNAGRFIRSPGARSVPSCSPTIAGGNVGDTRRNPASYPSLPIMASVAEPSGRPDLAGTAGDRMTYRQRPDSDSGSRALRPR